MRSLDPATALTLPIARALLLAAVLLSPAIASAQQPAHCTPIDFPRGASSAAVSGTAGSDEPFPCYALTTAYGQTASLNFAKTNGNMAFTIDGLIDDQESYTFKTAARTYRFIVFQTLRATPTPFTLSVSVR